MADEQAASNGVRTSPELELRLRTILRREYEDLYELWKSKDLVKLAQDQEVIIREGLEKLVTKIQDEQKPPTTEEIQKLLQKEYITFQVPIDYTDDNGVDKKETFTIRELPQSVEERFYTQFKTAILDKLPELQAFDQTGSEMKFEDKAKAILQLIGDGFTAMADTVRLILNPPTEKFPEGKKKHVTMQWVKDNISSDRQWSIIEAQIEVNRLRDFFSRVSQSGQRTMMTMRTPNFQQLQQLVR